MPSRTIFSKEQIIAVALELLAETGWKAVSARTLAKALGSSTMPIYSIIGSMESLEREMARQVSIKMTEYQRRPWTGNSLLNLAVGYVKFAQENPRLFDFFTQAMQNSGRPDSRELHLESMEQFRQFEASFAQPDSVIFDIWIYIHGLAQLMANGVIVLSDEEIVQHAGNAGGAFSTYNAGNRRIE